MMFLRSASLAAFTFLLGSVILLSPILAAPCLSAATVGGFSFDAPLSLIPFTESGSGDFNHDGKPDLALFMPNLLNVTELYIFLGNGDGTFQQPSTYQLGQSPCCIAIGDLNGDGIQDIVVVTGTESDSGSLSILFGKGDGTFLLAPPLDIGGSPSSIASADLNGDGKIDIVLTSTNDVLVLLGDGNGGFAPPVQYPAAGGPVTIADFNGDRIPDLAVISTSFGSEGTILIFLGNGDGTFQSPIRQPAGYYPVQIVTADFNGDGKVDMAVGSLGRANDGTLAILLGNGDGTFQAPVYHFIGLFGALATGDLNHDGSPDLVLCHNDATVILLGNGDGTFTQSDNFHPNGLPVIADFNGDGKPDLEISGAVLLGTGEGTFEQDVTYAVGNTTGAIAIGDFNGDGIPDAAVALVGQQRAVAILIGRGDGTFGRPDYLKIANKPIFMAVADFNRDGKLDLVVIDGANDENRVVVALGNGDGTFQLLQELSTGGQPAALAVADFNGDGIADLAIPNSFATGRMAVLFGNGDGTFQPAVQYLVGSYPVAVAAADFNGDGKPDIAVSTRTTFVSVLLNKGDGTFAAPVDYPSPAYNPVAVAAADFNGDGRPDLAVVGLESNSSGGVSILLNAGDGSFLPPVTYPSDLDSYSIAIADLNKDGALDLAICGRSTVTLLAGNGKGTFANPAYFALGYNYSYLAIADLNGDGLPDIVTDSGLNDIAVLLNKLPAP